MVSVTDDLCDLAVTVGDSPSLVALQTEGLCSLNLQEDRHSRIPSEAISSPSKKGAEEKPARRGQQVECARFKSKQTVSPCARSLQVSAVLDNQQRGYREVLSKELAMYYLVCVRFSIRSRLSVQVSEHVLCNPYL